MKRSRMKRRRARQIVKVHGLATVASETRKLDGSVVVKDHLYAAVTVDREDLIIERFTGMAEGEWAEVPVTRIIRAERKRPKAR